MKLISKTHILILYIVILTACNTNKNSNCIISHNNFNETTKIKTSELFSDGYRYIKLDSAGADMIGRVNKIIKYSQSFFILSDNNRIIEFDINGRFRSILYEVGKGPNQYSRIEDFDVAFSDNKVQIWLADYSKLKIYEYDSHWKLSKSISYASVINKFKLLQNDKILLMTGQNDQSLTLADKNGNELNRYLQKQISFLTFKPVQFVEFSDGVLFPLGVANEFVYFNNIKEEFKHEKYLCSNDYISAQELIDMFQDQGYDFLFNLKSKAYINNIRFANRKIILQTNVNGERFLTIVKEDGSSVKVKCAPESSVIDDITPSENSNFLNNLLYADSKNSVLFLQEPESMNECYAIVEMF